MALVTQKLPSRYRKTPRYIVLVDPDRTEGAMISFRNTILPEFEGSLQYRVKGGDTFQGLATRFYNAPEYWYILADANPQVFYPGDLDNFVGEFITIIPKNLIKRL